MRSIRLLAFTLFAPLPFAAARGSTIDDFVLKGESNIITFSLPSPAAGIPSMGPGGIVGGFYVLGGAYVTFNGTPQQDTLEFLSGALLSVGAGLILQSPGGQLVLTGPLLYTGGPYSPTFNTGPFNLTNFSDGNPYSLSITAESAAAPEPGTLLLLSTGLIAAVTGGRRQTKRTLQMDGRKRG